MKRARVITDLRRVDRLAADERDRLTAVTEGYVFRLSEYYYKLIDWDDPDDPLRHIVIPHVTELDEYGKLDPSDEADNYAARGRQHKYPQTARCSSPTCAPPTVVFVFGNGCLKTMWTKHLWMSAPAWPTSPAGLK